MKYEMVLVNSWNIEQYGASVGMILMQNCTISLISNGFHELLVYYYRWANPPSGNQALLRLVAFNNSKRSSSNVFDLGLAFFRSNFDKTGGGTCSQGCIKLHHLWACASLDKGMKQKNKMH